MISGSCCAYRVVGSVSTKSAVNPTREVGGCLIAYGSGRWTQHEGYSKSDADMIVTATGRFGRAHRETIEPSVRGR